MELVRGPQVIDIEWARIQAVFGLGGPHPAKVVETPLTVFLEEIGILSSWPHPESVHWNPTLKDVIERHFKSYVVEATDDQRNDDVVHRLSGSRFRRLDTLKSFQVRDVGRLLTLPHGLNFSVPGAGKTRVTLAVYEAERVTGRVDRLLIIAPNSAFEAWLSEISDILDLHVSRGDVAQVEDRFPRAEICIINYPRLANRLTEAVAWVWERPTMLVLDEGHRAKRGTSGFWGRACLSLAQFAERRDVLTGTPAPQSVADLIPLLQFAHLSGGPTRIQDVTAPVSEVAIQIKDLYVRTNKAELELPPAPVQMRYLPMRPLHGEIYRALRGIYGNRPANVDARGYFARLGRVTFYLLMAATNPMLLRAGVEPHDPIEFLVPPLDLPPGSNLAELFDRYDDFGPPAKYEEAMRIVKENAALGRKTLIWSTFVRNLTSLKLALSVMQPALVYGGVPLGSNSLGPSRQEEIDRFRHDPDCWVMLANPGSLGEGLSLHQACQDAIYLDRSFNAGHFLQSVDRIHRLGLDIPARITVLVSEGTIDTVVASRLAVKVGNLAMLLEDTTLHALALPDEETAATLLDQDDLQALFEHLSIR
ncbi:DEAD/DEAH box helicase [Nonomuraea sp. NPDC048892]|uniref:DEAD/DEAH box helicase n=1 Tax=Nonomuraea sp. NPDC048892 TaxID=3154624 RepID=UPI0033DBCB8F